MKIPKGYGLPIMVSLALHGFLIGLMLANWSFTKKMTFKTVQPKHIEAKLVAYESPPAPRLKSKPMVQKTVSAPKPKVKPKPKPKIDRKANQQAKQKQLALQKQKAKKLKKQQELKKRQELEKQRQAKKREQERLLKEQFQSALASEQQQIKAAHEAKKQAELSSSYSSLINDRIRSNWSRPPSARNGMVSVIQISFVPTGEIINVRMVKGSGSTSFDLSAMQAIKLTKRIPELQKLAREQPRLFDRQFRSLQITFRPEDLLR